jgi:alkylhydroperoxidase family enzyme
VSRIEPAEPPYAPELEAELARWMPPGGAVPPLALFRTLVRNLPLAAAMRPLGSHLLGRGLGLARREREIVIDRVSARCGCEYEWGVHVAAFGARVGLDPEELRATALRDASAWAGRDALLVRLVDELHDTSRVSDDLWRRLAAEYSEETLLELLVLVGWYHVIAFVANGAGVARESWAPRLPEAPGGEA